MQQGDYKFLTQFRILFPQGGYEFLEQQKHKTEQFLREVLQQKLDVSVEELTDTVVDTLLDEHGGALDLTDEQQENLARARGSKRRTLLEQVSGTERKGTEWSVAGNAPDMKCQGWD